MEPESKIKPVHIIIVIVMILLSIISIIRFEDELRKGGRRPRLRRTQKREKVE